MFDTNPNPLIESGDSRYDLIVLGPEKDTITDYFEPFDGINALSIYIKSEKPSA